MKNYSALIIFTIVLPLFFIFGCSDSKENNPIYYNLIASEKNLPALFRSSDYTIRKSNNQNEFEENWSFYRLETELPKVDFDLKNVIFIGLEELGNCPHEITNENIELVSDNQDFKLTLPEQHGVCFTSATPRTFVIEIDKAISNDIKNIVIIDEVETIISYEDL